MSITRQFGFPNLHSVQPAMPDPRVGLVKVVAHDNLVYAIPIARPGGMFHPDGAPLYSNSDRTPWRYPMMLQRGKTPQLNLPNMKLEMDPSDIHTWQRYYRFTS